MARLVSYTNFYELGIKLISQTYEHAGEINNVAFNSDSLSSPDYPIKTILTNGSIELSFPETDTPPIVVSTQGGVWPPAQAIGKTKINKVMLEDNVQIQCVQPIPNYKIVYTNEQLSAGSSITIDKGVLLFVFGNNYSVNNKAYDAFQMFAVQNSSATITAINNTKLVIFKSVPK